MIHPEREGGRVRGEGERGCSVCQQAQRDRCEVPHNFRLSNFQTPAQHIPDQIPSVITKYHLVAPGNHYSKAAVGEWGGWEERDKCTDTKPTPAKLE